MKAKLFKAGVWALEGVGIAVAILVASAAYIVWRAQTGPVALNWTAPVFEWAAVRSSSAIGKSDVREVSFQKTGRGRYKITLGDVSIFDQNGEPLAGLAEAELGFAAKDFWSARFGPETIALDETVVRIVRRADYQIALDYGGGDQPVAPTGADVFKSLTGGPYFRDAFQSATLRNTQISFFDEASGRAWTASEASAAVTRTELGYAATVEGEFLIGDAPARLAMDAAYNLDTEIIDATLDLERAPVGDLISLFFGLDSIVFDGVVSGKAGLKATSEGEVIASSFSGAAGEGVLSLPGLRASIRSIAVTTAFDPLSDQFDIGALEIASDLVTGTIKGNVALEGTEKSATPKAVSFDIQSPALTINHDTLDAPLQIETMSLNAGYSLADHMLQVRALEAGVAGVQIGGAFSLGRPEGEVFAALGDIEVSGELDKERLLSIWPKPVAWAARRFVKERITKARFFDVRAALNVNSETIDDAGHMTDDALTLSFSADNAAVVYAPGMKPVTRLAGAGSLKGNSFVFNATTGRVGKVKLKTAKVDIPRLRPKGHPADFSFTANGDAGDILAILNDPPMQVMKSSRFSPEQFSGVGEVSATITRPNQRDVPRTDYRYTAKASFPSVSVSEFYGDFPVTDGVAEVSLETGSLVITGEATLGAIPVTYDWRQRFGARGSGAIMTIDGIFDSAAGDLLGFPTRQFLSGRAPFSFEASGDANSFNAVKLKANLTDAMLFLEQAGWAKPPGVQAEAVVDFVRRETQSDLRTLRIVGETMRIEGAAKFADDWRLIGADFPQVFLDGAADLSAKVTRLSDDGVDLTLTGKYLNAGQLIETTLSSGGASPESERAPLMTTMRLDNLELRNGVRLSDAALDLRIGRETINSVDFAARDIDGHPLSVTLQSTGVETGFSKALVARTDDVGALLSGVMGLTSLKGGQGVIEFSFAEELAEGETSRPPHGVLEARNLRIVGAPLLARIFSAGSLTGFSDLLNGEGIEIAQAFADFEIDNGVVKLERARAAGPSLGVSGEGEFELKDGGAIAINGAVAPAYQINSFLGKTPIVGELFVNRDGEGLFALAYDVSGEPSNAVVSVNPLSALTPGVFRRMFETSPTDEIVDDTGDTP